MKRFTDKTITEFPDAGRSAARTCAATALRSTARNSCRASICVGAAIRDQAGAVIGAISASTPTMRASDEHLALMREEISAATRALSAEFGEPGAQKPQAAQAAAS